MYGQWIGKTTGTNVGKLALNIEKRSPNVGKIFFEDVNKENLHFIAKIDLEIKNSKVNGNLYDFIAFDEDAYKFIETSKTQDASLPKKGVLEGSIHEEGTIRGKWSTDIGTNGGFGLYQSALDKKYEADETFNDWQTFKDWITAYRKEGDGLIFRGQSSPLRLRTLFHRLGRYDLISYTLQNIPELRRQINAVTSFKYDLNNFDNYGSLLSLAQHHGYPTPLLDWTESPYVAAYFSYEGVEKRFLVDEYVRIFVFDVNTWKKYIPQVLYLEDPRLTITIAKFSVYNNTRAIPQQAIQTFSNVDDIELFIKLMEKMYSKKFLIKLDLLASHRNIVMEELRMMNITAASLFPGLDGICKALKEKDF